MKLTKEQFKEIRENLFLSQKELAERMPCQKTTVNLKESGKLPFTQKDVKLFSMLAEKRLIEITEAINKVNNLLREAAKEVL